jgi:hypothetical protein
MSATDDLWIPLVDEPIGLIVEEIYAADPELAELVGSPRRLLAFRTFAYIRVGMLLGQLLVENDVPEHARGDENWIEALLRDPRHREAVAAAVRGVVEEVARESDAEPVSIGRDGEARQRFREFARRQRDS